MKKTTVLGFACICLLSACSNSGKVDQENLCEVSGWQRDVVANACKPGQKVVFLTLVLEISNCQLFLRRSTAIIKMRSH